MHMADALLSPAVGGALWVGSALTATVAVRKMKYNLDEKKIPLMGVMGAFIFAAQMINFSIPGTGSSGHIGGGMLLAVLLGPYAGFLTMASVLLIQALVFADGGLLAFGCNLFNMGFYTCFLAYPCIYRTITRSDQSKGRLSTASVISVIVALQLGAFSVALETFLSGKVELPLKTFVLFMQPIHLAIGLVEGLITAAVILFIREARPDLILNKTHTAEKSWPLRKLILVMVVIAMLIGGFVSWFASNYPDGLEWSIEKVTGSAELESSEGIHKMLGEIQQKTSILPDYQIKGTDESSSDAQKVGTSVSGIAGSIMTLGSVAGIALCISFFKKGRDAHSRAR